MTKLLKQSAVVFAIKVAGSTLAFALHLVIARSLGPAGSGQFFFAVSTVVLTAIVARLGFENVIVRQVAPALHRGDMEKIKSLEAGSVRIVAAASVVCALLVWVLLVIVVDTSPHTDGTGGYRFGLTMLAVPAVALSIIYSEFLRGLGSINHYQFIQGVSTPMMALFFFWVLSQFLDVSVSIAEYAYVSASFCSVLIAVLLFRRKTGQVHSRHRVEFFRMIRQSWQLYVIGLTAALIDWLALVLLARYSDPADVGIYGVASRSAVIVTFILAAVNSAVAPSFAVIYSEGRLAELEASARHARKILVSIGAPIVLALLLGADLLVGLFGPGFESAAWVLRILLVGQFISIVCGSVGNLLLMTGNERPLFFLSMASVVVILGTGFLLVPAFGAMGAAAAVAMTVAMRNLGATYFVRRRLGIGMLWRSQK